MTNRQKNTGFTLIELSVVLVVVGMIIGGIVIGQSLIRSAQLRDVLVEYDTQLQAIKEFQDKYHALPGDMKTAESIWGTDPAGCPAASASATPTRATCNGDGNGHISDNWNTGSPPLPWETYRAWQHLANAGLIPGMYSGKPAKFSPWGSSPGYTNPASKLHGAEWQISYFNALATIPAAWGDTYGHVMTLGSFVSGSTYIFNYGGAMTPREAESLDAKVDDGMPGTGKIRTWRNALVANCILTASDTNGGQATATYDISNTNPICPLYFILGF